MLGDLLAGQPLDVARIAQLVEEELQLGDVAQLEVLVRGGSQPGAQLPEALVGE